MADASDAAKPICKYGAECYRKNPVHLAEFRHPHAVGDHPQAESNNAMDSDDLPPTTSHRRRHSINDTTDASSHQSSEPESKKSATIDTVAAPPSLPSPPAAPLNTSREQQCFDSDNDQALRAEYANLLRDRPAFILDKFLVHMPTDFYAFWDFCTVLQPANPAAALERYQLRLVGPFDVLAGHFDGLAPREPADYLRHWRFFYDPPEFQTVLATAGGKRDGLHYGYWRDDPQLTGDEAVLVARTDCDRGCEVQLMAENLFAAVLQHLETEVKLTPFDKPHADALQKKLRAFAEERGIRLDGLSSRLRQRNLTVVTRTFHTAGLVVAVDRQSDVGYRPMAETPAVLRKMLARLDDPEDGNEDGVVARVMEKVQPLVTAANIAVDESDFGTAIELGVDFFCHGSKRLHGLAMQLLATGYAMVQRPQLIAIVKAHLSQRRQGKDVSIL